MENPVRNIFFNFVVKISSFQPLVNLRLAWLTVSGIKAAKVRLKFLGSKPRFLFVIKRFNCVQLKSLIENRWSRNREINAYKRRKLFWNLTNASRTNLTNLTNVSRTAPVDSFQLQHRSLSGNNRSIQIHPPNLFFAATF